MKKLGYCMIAIMLLAGCRAAEPAAVGTMEVIETEAAVSSEPEETPSEEPEETETPQESPEAETGETVTFGGVQAYDGTVYATDQYARVTQWSQLPVEARFFGIYQGELYYSLSSDVPEGGTEVPLYRSDLDGGNAVELTDNLSVDVMPRIISGKLIYISNGAGGEMEETAGLYRLDLATGEREQMHQGMYYTIFGQDDTHVYYRIYEQRDGEMTLVLYKMDVLTGERVTVDGEISGDFIYDEYIYMARDTEIVKADPETGEAETIVDNYDELGGFAVSGGWIYYSDETNVCKASIDGGEPVILCEIGDSAYWAESFMVVDGYVYFYEYIETDEAGMNSLFCRVPVEGGQREALYTLYIN